MYREVGTKVQYRNGYIRVKIEGDDGKPKWEAESRRNWELSHGDLDEGDRVFHIDGDRTNNKVNNLAKVHFNAVKFTFLKQSRVLWEPKRRERKPIAYSESVKEFDKRVAMG